MDESIFLYQEKEAFVPSGYLHAAPHPSCNQTLPVAPARLAWPRPAQ